MALEGVGFVRLLRVGIPTGGGEGQAGQGHPWQTRDLRAEPEGSAGQCGRERLHHALPPAMSFVPRGKKHQLVKEAGEAPTTLHLLRCEGSSLVKAG